MKLAGATDFIPSAVRRPLMKTVDAMLYGGLKGKLTAPLRNVKKFARSAGQVALGHDLVELPQQGAAAGQALGGRDSVGVEDGVDVAQRGQQAPQEQREADDSDSQAAIRIPQSRLVVACVSQLARHAQEPDLRRSLCVWPAPDAHHHG